MHHDMKLNPRPYEAIRWGRKRFEIRLHDEKRQQIAVGDTITFTSVSGAEAPLRVEVTGLRRYATFANLYTDIPLRDIDCEGWTLEELLSSTYTIYSREQELRYGALAIEIKVLD